MKSIIFSLVALTVAVSAQTTTTTAATGSPTCDAQPVLEQCLITTEGYVSLCASTDYSCLCDKYTAELTCFGNCPNDSRQSSVSQQKELNCMNASIYSSLASTTTAAGSSSAAAATTTTTKSSAQTSATGTTTTTSSTTSASGSTQTNGGGELVGSGSGLLAAVAGVVVAML
ncbi:putative Extracellular membrane protein CFEM domain-containing protein [Seiridium cardinale]|uniref:Extracellular membrane protein CFEM domain-containing protein n=1 Tax=Seiridium cardinale TaxID=138064 RepID=A0ABR2XL20_9PEZI